MLTNDEFFNYARKHYDNPTCRTVEEFTEDINRFKYLRKLLVRYNSGEDINLRLILNHIMILFNVFETKACIVMLFFKLEPEFHPMIKTFLLALNMMPNKISEINLISSDIPLDQKVVAFMREIYGSSKS